MRKFWAFALAVSLAAGAGFALSGCAPAEDEVEVTTETPMDMPDTVMMDTTAMDTTMTH